VSDTSESTVQEAYDALRGDGAVLIDVRQPWEYEEQRIPGATLIPLSEVPDRISEIPADKDVFVHCEMGGRSAKAVDFLVQNGRPRSRNVAGGINAWKAAGFPVDQ